MRSSLTLRAQLISTCACICATFIIDVWVKTDETLHIFENYLSNEYAYTHSPAHIYVPFPPPRLPPFAPDPRAGGAARPCRADH